MSFEEECVDADLYPYPHCEDCGEEVESIEDGLCLECWAEEHGDRCDVCNELIEDAEQHLVCLEEGDV